MRDLKVRAIQPELSVVAPLHNEEANVGALFQAICAALEPLGRSFEVLLVDDGSTDRTGELLDDLAADDPRLAPVHLDGNFGEAAALCAGFEMARAPVILTLDGDLQNDPADLPRLLALLEAGAGEARIDPQGQGRGPVPGRPGRAADSGGGEFSSRLGSLWTGDRDETRAPGGYRAVSGWRRQRQEQFLQRVLPSLTANWLIARVTGVPSRDNGCGLKAYRAEVVKGVYLPHGLHRFMPAVFGVRAGEFAQIEVTDRRRRAGRSHYGLSRSFAVLRDLMVIPYLPRNAQPALQQMERLTGAAGLMGLGALLLLGLRHWELGLALCVIASLLLAYAQCVRANLQRWLRAQKEMTFRIRGTGGRPAPAVEGARKRAGVRS